MRRYFTSDLHLGSSRILELCKRPFLDNIEMTDKLIQNCNEIAREKDDVLYHIGDLYCLKDDNGRPGMLLPWRETKKRFTANVVNIEGNHDTTNGVKSMATSMRMVLGKAFNVVLCHYPSTAFHDHYFGWVHLYGHVHSSYEWNVTENAKRLLQRLYVRDDVCRMYNAGAMIPAMAYTPRTLDEITGVSSGTASD